MGRGKGEVQYRGRGKKGLSWNYMKSCCVNFLKFVKHYRIKRIFHSITKKVSNKIEKGYNMSGVLERAL